MYCESTATHSAEDLLVVCEVGLAAHAAVDLVAVQVVVVLETHFGGWFAIVGTVEAYNSSLGGVGGLGDDTKRRSTLDRQQPQCRCVRGEGVVPSAGLWCCTVMRVPKYVCERRCASRRGKKQVT